MIDADLLKILVCPSTHTPLRIADARLMARLNRAIAAGRITNSTTRTLETPLEGGLVREDGAVLYPVMNDIPLLLCDEAIALDQLDQ